MSFNRFTAVCAASLMGLSACAGVAAPSMPGRVKQTPYFPNIGYATWTEDEPPYRLYAGDQIEVATPTAPELTRTVTVAPDGRISLPLIDPVMVADRTIGEAQAAISASYADQLVNPRVEIAVKAATPLKVFVGGEVQRPGVYDMPGAIDALQAVIQAGGFTKAAKKGQVVIIRRGADGRAMMRTANLDKGIRDPANTDVVPLRRFDLIYVPRSTIGEVGAFMSQIREALPIGFSYSLNSPYQ